MEDIEHFDEAEIIESMTEGFPTFPDGGLKVCRLCGHHPSSTSAN